jgi:type I restriction enzyme S subunit
MAELTIPREWMGCKVSEFTNIVMGQSPPSSAYNDQANGLPFYQGKAEFGDIYPEPVKWCNAPRKIAEKGAILMSVRAPVGPTNINPHRSCIGRGLAAIHPLGNMQERFLLYLFRSYEPILSGQGKGTTFKAITKDFLFDLQFSLPPLTEQSRILESLDELFSDLDNAIENLKKVQSQLKTYRQVVMQFAFDGRLTNKNLKEGELPEGWKNVRLGEVCKSVEYGSAAKSKKAGKIPVLRMGNIQNGKFDWADLVYTDDEKETEKYALRTNDVLFNRTNSPEWVGKTAIYKGERPAIFAGYLIRINRIESLIDASYLTYYLNSHTAKKYGDSVKSFGVNQSNINGTKLKTYPLPLAPLREQHTIVQEIESRFSMCDKMDESIDENLQKANILRQSILKHAFEGMLTEEWRKEHADLINGENSAEALLKKIKAEKEALQGELKGKKKHD